MKEILVDPNVSKIKFEREVKSLLDRRDQLRKRGWLIEAISFPKIRVTFLAINLSPPIAPLTVEIDFTNYNLYPPSVELLNPINLNAQNLIGLQENKNIIIQKHPNTKKPFLCLPGVREYHNHPQHDGDSWDLHRYKGEGSLYFLLEKIWEYSIKPIKAYIVPVQFTSSKVGIVMEEKKNHE